MLRHATAAMRTALAAAMAVAVIAMVVAVMVGPQSAAEHATGPATGEKRYKPMLLTKRLIHSTDRLQLEAALRNQLASANVDASEDDIAGAVDGAMRLLVGWTGETALRGCSPSGQLCFVITCTDC